MAPLDVAFAASLDELDDEPYQSAVALWHKIRTAGARPEHLTAIVELATYVGAEAALNVAEAIDTGAPDDAVNMLIGLLR